MLDWIELTEATLEELDAALPAGVPKAAGTLSVASVVRKGGSGEFSAVGLKLDDEIVYYPTDGALNQLATAAGLPLSYVASLPDPLLRANFNYALRNLVRRRSLAAIVQGRQIRGWAGAEWIYLRPSQFLAGLLEARPDGGPLGLLGKPVSSGWLMRYRLSTPQLAHAFRESPVRADVHHFAVEIVVDHLGWKPAQLGLSGSGWCAVTA